MSYITELEWSLRLQAPAVDGEVYEFQVFDSGTLLAPADSPSITVGVVVSSVTLDVANAFHSVISNNVTTYNISQEGFRWRNDDGSQTTATWLAAQDTNTSVTLNTSARLRVLIDTNSQPPPTKYILYYKNTVDSTWIPVPVGTGGGSPVYVATSPNIVTSGEDTTAQLTPPTGKSTANFSTGRMWDDENSDDLINII